MKTFLARKEDVERRWFELDARGHVLGRVAVKAANILMGKEKPTFTRGVDTGDFVVVTNARHVKVTGRKEDRKIYRTHSPWVGSMVERPLGLVRSRRPERLIYLAVKRMLPKNNLAAYMLRRLKIYAESGHPHAAQAPSRVDLPARRGGRSTEKSASASTPPSRTERTPTKSTGT